MVDSQIVMELSARDFLLRSDRVQWNKQILLSKGGDLYRIETKTWNFEVKIYNFKAKRYNFGEKRYNFGTKIYNFGAKRYNFGTKIYNFEAKMLKNGGILDRKLTKNSWFGAKPRNKRGRYSFDKGISGPTLDAHGQLLLKLPTTGCKTIFWLRLKVISWCYRLDHTKN